MPTYANIHEPDTARRSDSVFRRLPVLEELISDLDPADKPFKNTGFACVQHLLETTGSLIEMVLRCGAEPDNVFVLGKLYSNCADVQNRLRSLGVNVAESRAPRRWGTYHQHFRDEVRTLWGQMTPVAKSGRLQKILVLDDGGHAVTSIPTSLLHQVKVIGVEQTMSGTFGEHLRRRTIPVIDVASSAAKKLIEAPLIATAVLQKLATSGVDLDSQDVYGVVGCGNVGSAISSSLTKSGRKVCLFDVQRQLPTSIPQVEICRTLEDLFSKCTYIFGCTGRDILKGSTWWKQQNGDKVLISCSSSDIEFSSVLAMLNKFRKPSAANALETVTVQLPKGRMTILRGGYPINFDGTHESVPAAHIQMTRGLLFGALLQAMTLRSTHSRSQMLSPVVQKRVVNTWMALTSDHESAYDAGTRALFHRDDAIVQCSGGSTAFD